MKSLLNRTIIIMVALLFTVGSLPLTSLAKKYEPDYGTENNVAEANGGMVTSAHPLASEIGAEVLKTNGNAVDAAVAMQFALNVTEPMMSGIGGGGFMMVYDAETDETTIINSRERAPQGATPDMFLDNNGSPIPFQERVRHGNSVGVPGTLLGMETALEKWGTRPMQQLIGPAVKLADKGFPIDSVLANSIESNKEKLLRSAAKDVFFPNGEALKEGEILIQKDLANTFKKIRSHGSDVFYQGEIADAIAETVQDFGGSMIKDDLNNYDVTVDEPIWGTYQGYDIASMPPPSSGGVFLLQMLGILDGFDLSQYDIKSWEKYHLLAETMHLAYADRAAFAGDPEFVDVPLNGLLHPDYIDERRALIELDAVNRSPQSGEPWVYENVAPTFEQIEQTMDKEDGETTHFTVADKYGNVVSYTTTIEQVFGSGIMVPEYGILLNNELTDFDAVPGGANEVQPNKRPLSSMTPTIVFDEGKPVLTVGSPGGTTIITSVLQTIINVIEYEMNLQDALEEPRIYTNTLTSYRYETGVPKNIIEQLNDMGHAFGSNPTTIGNVNSLLINHETGIFTGVSDTNRNGAAIGVDLKGKRK